MANWANPTLTSTYANFVTELDTRLDDVATGFPAAGTFSNLPTGTISFRSNKWQRWNGSAWADLAASYAINISGTAANVTGTVSPTTGGTGLTAYAAGDVIYASATNTLAKLAAAATGNVLISGTTPSWGKVALASAVSGILPIANGGTASSDAAGARTALGLVIGTNVPSTTGTGASGTWGVSITGNAATVTNGVYLGTAQTISGVKTLAAELKYGNAINYVQKWTAGSALAADTYSLMLAGGGDSLQTRGGFIGIHGLNHATKAGKVEVYTGTSGEFSVYTPDGSQSLAVTNSGVQTKRGASTAASTGFLLASGADLGTVFGGAAPALIVYTTTQTWTKPAGLKAILVEVQAGGGVGGNANALQAAGGGGAGGYARKLILAAALGASETVTASGNASFGSHCSATQGSAGTGGGAGNIAGGAGGTGAGGDLNIVGERGSPPEFAQYTSFYNFLGGAGGGSVFGGAGAAVYASTIATNGNAATGYGSGGGGAARSINTAGTNTGGAAGGAVVIVTEFY